MNNKHTNGSDLVREATTDLRNMVPETSNGRLNFRLAETGEKALNRHERRLIGRYFSLGLNDEQIAGVLSTW